MGKLRVEIISILGDASIHPCIRALAESLKKELPSVIHKCPYKKEGIYNLSVNKVMGTVLPQVIPKGTYKGYARAYQKDNTTILTGEMIFDIDAVDFMKSMKIG